MVPTGANTLFIAPDGTSFAPHPPTEQKRQATARKHRPSSARNNSSEQQPRPPRASSARPRPQTARPLPPPPLHYGERPISAFSAQGLLVPSIELLHQQLQELKRRQLRSYGHGRMTNGAITRLPEGQRVLTYRTSGSADPRPSSAAGPRPSLAEPPSEPRAFTTLFDSRNVAHKRALSTQEQIQYFFTGIAGLADRKPLTKREQPAGNEATRKARRQVLYLIEAREGAVELLRELMPTPIDEKHGDRLAHQIFTSRDTAPLFEMRERFSALLSMVRALSVAIVDATDCWRRELRRSSSHYRSFPDLELPFIWGEPSRSYSAHMCTDLNFLPAPVLADPLLAEWLGRQLEWVLARVPNVDGPSSHTSRGELRAFVGLVREACPSTTHIEELVRSLAPAAAKAADATLGAHRRAMLIASPGALTSPETLHRAQTTILVEAARYGLMAPDPATLLRHARHRSRGKQHVWDAAMWRWSAWEALLYGHSGAYTSLLKGLPQALDAFRMHDAAAVLQRIWRRRTERRMFWLVANAEALEKARQASGILLMRNGAANKLQKSVRARQLRRAFQDVSSGLVQRQRKLSTRLSALEAKRQREAEQARAAISIQRRTQVVAAKRHAKLKHQRSKTQGLGSDNLMAQMGGVAILARQLLRYKASRHEMAIVYQNAVLDHYAIAASAATPTSANEDVLTPAAMVLCRQRAKTQQQEAARALLAAAQQAEEGLECVQQLRSPGDQPAGSPKGPPPRVPLSDVLALFTQLEDAAFAAAMTHVRLAAEHQAWQDALATDTAAACIGGSHGSSPGGGRNHILSLQLQLEKASASVRTAADMVKHCTAAVVESRGARLESVGIAVYRLDPPSTVPAAAAADSTVASTTGIASPTKAAATAAAAAAAAAASRPKPLRRKCAADVLRGYADALDRMMADGSVPSAGERMVGNQLGSFQALQMRRAADELDTLEDEARQLEAAKEAAALDLVRAQGFERALMAMVAIQNQHKAAAVVPSEAAAMAASKSASAAACLAELELAAAERAWRKQAVDRAKPLLTTWLRLEGASRMHTELQAQERERLRSLLLAQRAQAYRRVGETPVAERVAYKRAVRELAATAAAQLELASVGSMVVQTRTYTEGCVTLNVLDRAEPAVVAALTNDPEAQKEMLGSLAAFLGEFDEERLYMASAERVSVLLRTSKREWLEPASRLVIGVRLEKLGQLPAAQLISEVISAHDRRELGRQIGVPHESVHTFSSTPPVEHLTEAPTLWQLRAAADARTAAAEADLKRLEKDKLRAKPSAKAFATVNGALARLEQLGALPLLGVALEADARARCARVAELLDVGKDSSLEALASAAATEAAQVASRRAARQALVESSARSAALELLHMHTLSSPRPAGPPWQMACDLAWNLGLPVSKGDQYCFYCAGLTPPVRATHPQSACPKRKRAGDREYTSFAMERVLSAVETRRLRHEHVVAAVAAEAFSAATAARKQAKQDLIAIAAAVKLLVDPAEDTALAPPPPPPPPASERRRMWETHMRRRQGDAHTVMGMLGRAARHMPNPWAELKAVALFTPHSRVLQRPVDAAWLHAVGRSVGLDVGIGGKDHVLLPFVIELARAPLPPGWSAVSGGGAYRHAHASTGSMVEGHPLSAAMGSHIAGIISRARRTQRLKPMGSWLQMASEDGRSPIFVDLHSGTASHEFPTVRGISACVLPQRQLEPSAERLAAAAEACWRDVPDADVVSMAKLALWAEGGGRLARARQLWHAPCPLDTLVLLGQYLGLEASVHPTLMWLVDCALTLALPLGWQRVELLHAQGGECAREYYCNSAFGLAQWEHPQLSFLTGVARRLRRAVEGRPAMANVMALPVEAVDEAKFDSGGRRGPPLPPTVYITEPEEEPEPRPPSTEPHPQLEMDPELKAPPEIWIIRAARADAEASANAGAEPTPEPTPASKPTPEPTPEPAPEPTSETTPGPEPTLELELECSVLMCLQVRR